jgi:hypothetical protein
VKFLLLVRNQNFLFPRGKAKLTPSDGHNDWPHLIRAYYQNALDGRFAVNKNLAGHVDIGRLIRGKSGGAFWSVFMPW